MNKFSELTVGLSNSTRLLINEPMSRHSSFAIGGSVAVLARPADFEGLDELLKRCAALSIPAKVIGNASNLLICDDALDAVLIQTVKMDKIELVGETAVRAHCGCTLSKAAAFARNHSLTGLEFAYGIPGTVGGAVFMNAGAYCGEMKDIVKSSLCRDREGRCLTVEEHEFSYRTSIFKRRRDLTLLSTTFCLHGGNSSDICAKMDEFSEKRRKMQPLELPSAGSVFKRPQGYFAGRLIEDCGLKGFRIGGAQVSEKHAGFIVNRGDAKCSDVIKLIEYIKEKVFTQFGVNLECELEIISKDELK